MRTLSKFVGISFLVFFGTEFSVAQVNNSNNNANAQQPAQVQTQQAPATQNQSSGGPVLGPSTNLPPDGAYTPQDADHRRVVPPAQMRAADVMWKQRIWRVINTKEKINQQLYYPVEDNSNRISLFQLIKNALLSGEISAYDFNIVDLDDYRVRLTKTEVQGKLSSIDTIPDENGNMKAVTNDVDPGKIRGYMLKEDWHFEKQRSVIDPRILWICPRIVTINKNTNQEDPTAGPTSLFWVSFPEIRPLLAKTPVFNQQNDAEWRTFDDIFWKRQFNSQIVMSNNVYNRAIAAYLKGVDALQENDKIHDKIAELEHDMWQY